MEKRKSPDLLTEILTEYDDRVSSELNLDPLGLQVIWSSYGQAIFRSRISSISNDVRNYTLNLFNHRVVKSLLDDAPVGSDRSSSARRTPDWNRDSMAFKQACLIHLENIFAFAVVEAERAGREDLATGGVLGISKARRKWEDEAEDPLLIFSHEQAAHVLARQTSLGVSGRYKTPLVRMEFFDSQYDYSMPSARRLWQTADEFLFAAGAPLAKLLSTVRRYMSELLLDTQRPPRRSFSKVPADVKSGLVNAFRTAGFVGGYAREFWLAVTELNRGASGALYEVLRAEQDGGHALSSAEDVFKTALRADGLAHEEAMKLGHVIRLEPFLAELDLMLDTMLSAKAQTLDDVALKLNGLGRDQETLKGLSLGIVGYSGMRGQLSGTAAVRLDALIELARESSHRDQMARLLGYHASIMESRGQSPWLRLVGEKSLKTDVRTRALPTDVRKVGSWVHHYYVPQFRHLLSGLRGVA